MRAIGAGVLLLAMKNNSFKKRFTNEVKISLCKNACKILLRTAGSNRLTQVYGYTDYVSN